VKKFILIICLATPLSSYSQFWRTLSFGIVSGPDKCFRALTAASENLQGNVDFLDSIQKPGCGYHMGASVLKPLNKHFCIETGFLYQKENYIIDKGPIIINPEFFSYMKCDSRKFEYNTNYLILPLGLRYYLNGNRVSIYFAGGIAPSYMLTRINKVFYYDGNKIVLKQFDYQISEINRFNIAGYCGVGASLFIGNYTRIDIAPNYQRMLLPLQFPNTSIKERIYKFGINFGLSANL